MDVHGRAAFRAFRSQIARNKAVFFCLVHVLCFFKDGIKRVMAGSPALHGEPVSFDFIHLLRIEAAHFEVAFAIGGEDEVVLLSDDIPEVLHDRRLFIFRAV